MRQRDASIIFASACLCFLVFACRRGTEQDADQKSAGTGGAAKGPIARVNGVAIPREPLEKQLAQVLGRSAQSGREMKPQARERLKDSIVARLVESEVVRQKAAALGVVASPEEEAEHWEAYKKRYGSEEAFRAAIERLGTTVDELRPQVAGELPRQKLLGQAVEGVTVTPDEVKAYYERNKLRLVDQQGVRLSEIVIRVPPNAPPDEKAEKKRRAEEVLKKATAKKADFAKLVAEYSEGPAKERGGDIGFIARNQLGKPQADAVWPLKVGEVRLVETPTAYVIAKKTEERPAHQKTLEETKDQIEHTVLTQKRQQAIRDALAKWKSEAKIEILEKGDEKIIAGERAPGPSEPPPAANPTPAGT